jgi:hypothetical protein
LTLENTTARIEKLTALSVETDPAIIHALAAQIWDLFNPNFSIAATSAKALEIHLPNPSPPKSPRD